MLNRFPLWKNLMVILLIAIGALYALPNLYGDDPSVQISGTVGNKPHLKLLLKFNLHFHL